MPYFGIVQLCTFEAACQPKLPRVVQWRSLALARGLEACDTGLPRKWHGGKLWETVGWVGVAIER